MLIALIMLICVMYLESIGYTEYEAIMLSCVLIGTGSVTYIAKTIGKIMDALEGEDNDVF